MLMELKAAWEELLNGQRKDMNPGLRHIADREKETSGREMRV
jgi:hypothetical protein